MAFNIGQRVKVVRKVEEAEGWNNAWVSSMDIYVGREATIASIDVMGIGFKEFGFHFPEESLGPCGSSNVAEQIAAYTAACEQFEAAELALEKAKAAVQDARLNLRDALDGES